MNDNTQQGKTMDIKQALFQALKGNSVLFLGAGFSYEARNKFSNRFPSANELSEDIQNRLTSPDDGVLSLKESSEDYIDEFGKEKLFSLISETFRTKNTTKDYSSLAKINWKRIYTTNYDDLVETTYRSANKTINSLLMTDEPALMTADDTTCLHLNGFVEKMALNKFNAEFKLTETSYLTRMFSNGKWKTIFNADLRECDYIFFIGYSLYDIDIELLLIENSEIKDKIVFITAPEPNSRLVKKLVKYGSVHNIGISGFLDELSISIDTWKEIKQEFHFTQLRRFISPTPHTDFKTNDIVSLFLYGEENQPLIKNAIEKKESGYYIFRSKIKNLDYDLRNNSCVVVHAKLANGKTLFCLGALEYLIEMGYTPFVLDLGKEITVREVEELKKEKKPLLLIENYHRHLKNLELIASLNTDGIKLLLSSRTELHEIYNEEITSIGWSHIDINVNYLTNEEIESVAKLMSSNGLFGEKSRLNDKGKTDLLKNKLRREFSLILGEILQAPQITERIESLLDLVNKDSELEDCLLICSIASYLSYDLDSIDIQTLTSVRGIDGVKYLKNEVASQILEKNNRLVFLKNPVLAKVIIERKSASDPRGMLEFLVSLYESLNKYSNGEAKYNVFMKDVNVFSNLLKIFGLKNVVFIDEFYERVRLYSDNSKNQHFWLQFAIAKLSIKDYPTAERFIQTTYSLAQGKSYNHDWVNCQYARLLIETASTLTSKEDRIDRIKQAHALIIGQNNRQYPFRVANKYFDFLEEVERDIDLDTKKVIAGLLREFDAKYIKTKLAMNNQSHQVMEQFRRRCNGFFRANPTL
ncbi:SIR2 family protein [Serratia proteamaculans]|uniref:SIR2 family protein n=1 Tax=Serratia proteamaculans TaxID=28151 RepID=UPI0039B0B39B